MTAIKQAKQQRILDCCTTQPKSVKQIAATIDASVSFVLEYNVKITNEDKNAMNLQQALKWADDNSQLEVVERLRSRKVAKVLALHIRRYRLWIKEQGEFTDTCTWEILGEVCESCECKRKPSNAIAQWREPLFGEAPLGSTVCVATKGG